MVKIFNIITNTTLTYVSLVYVLVDLAFLLLHSAYKMIIIERFENSLEILAILYMLYHFAPTFSSLFCSFFIKKLNLNLVVWVFIISITTVLCLHWINFWCLASTLFLFFLIVPIVKVGTLRQMNVRAPAVHRSGVDSAISSLGAMINSAVFWFLYQTKTNISDILFPICLTLCITLIIVQFKNRKQQ